MNLADLVSRADQLVQMGEQVMQTAYSSGGQYNVRYVQAAPMSAFRSASLSFIERVYGRNHPHFEQFSFRAGKHFRSDAEEGLAIVKVIREEIAGGWLFSIKSLITAEVFADFIEMAEHLVEAGYKDPAAVVIGSVLEEHLRQLCKGRALPVEDVRDGKLVPKKADRLNADLAKVDAYSKLDQKLVTAWLDLRNSAAHGKYDAYNLEQVKQMASGVVEFMARNAP
jgi:hypothetical protein